MEFSTWLLNRIRQLKLNFVNKKEDLVGKKIAVVGSGPAGMEAAIECAKRGATVTVYEKKSFIGGSTILGGHSMDKMPLQWLVEYYSVMIQKYGINVKLNYEVREEELLSGDIFAIFTATGSKPNIPGNCTLDAKKVYSVEQALEYAHDVTGKKIVIIGGGMTGCETAVHYAKTGNQVTVIELCDELAVGAYYTNIAYVQKEMKENHVDILLKHKYVETKDSSVILKNMETQKFLGISADMVIFSLGGKPENSLYKSLSGQRTRVYNIGDSVKVGRVADAVKSGFETAYVLDAEVLRP